MMETVATVYAAERVGDWCKPDAVICGQYHSGVED